MIGEKKKAKQNGENIHWSYIFFLHYDAETSITDSSWEFLKVDNEHIKQSKAIIIDEYNVTLLNILKK